ncbi:MAG: phage tail protein [Cellulosilyticaceae bacterium]
MIGALGDIVFRVSAKDVNTFQEFTRSSSGRWAYHAIHMQKPKSEFLGPELDTISFSMQLEAALGRNPRYDMEKLMIYTRNGQTFPLIIGGDAMGYYRWAVESVEQQFTRVNNKGKVISAIVNVTLKEYLK